MTTPGDDTRLASEREQRVEQLFHAALEQPADRRELWLAGQCEDSELRAEVSSLLGAHGEAPSVLEEPAWGLGKQLGGSEPSLIGERPSLIGERVGNYVIKAVLGEGGMGTVFLAEQVGALHREVALKVVKLGMDTREVVARFDSERRALARLNHANIAAVYDAGSTELGRPYFVMEYVPGERITEYCDRRFLPVRERLELFVRVCEAVQHAHHKGIIHRDLKPSNVLVSEADGGPLPKIIDFGVAKATSANPTSDRSGHTFATRQGQLIGTPGYMSPEQAADGAGEVDTRSDVYSLGVLLHELLTGVLPHDPAALRGSERAIRRHLAQAELPLASVRVASLGADARRVAARRRTDPRGLRRSLRGDLDWILSAGLEKDRELRYASAAELARDLRAHLADEPILARRPSLSVRVLKAARRHARPAAAQIAVALTAVAGVLLALAWYWPDSGAPAGRSDHVVAAPDLVELAEQLRELGVLSEDADSVDVLAWAGLLSSLAATPSAPADGQVVVQNVGAEPLSRGQLVGVVGLSPVLAHGGRPVLEVRVSERGQRGLPLGVVEAALIDGEVSSPSGVPAEQDLAAGAYGLVVWTGPFDELSVDGPVGAFDPLGTGPSPGVAALAQPGAAVVAVALEAWAGPGPGGVQALVLPAGRASSHPLATSALPAGSRQRSVESEPCPLDPDLPAWRHGVESRMAQLELALAARDEPVAEGVSGFSPSVQGGPTGMPDGVLPPPDAATFTAARDEDQNALPGGQMNPSTPDKSGSDVVTKTPVLNGDGTGDGTTLDDGDDNGGAGSTGVSDDTHLTSDDDVPEADREDGKPPGPGGQADVSPAAEPGLHQAWADYDGDGVQDVFLSDPPGPGSLLRNTGAGTFEDVTHWSGLAVGAAAVESWWLDIQRDGLLDLLVLDTEGRLRLSRGRGHALFLDGTFASGLSELAGAIELAWFDVDADGFTDLRVLTEDGSLRLGLNNRVGGFELVLLRGPGGGASGVVEKKTPAVGPVPGGF